MANSDNKHDLQESDTDADSDEELDISNENTSKIASSIESFSEPTKNIKDGFNETKLSQGFDDISDTEEEDSEDESWAISKNKSVGMIHSVEMDDKYEKHAAVINKAEVKDENLGESEITEEVDTSDSLVAESLSYQPAEFVIESTKNEEDALNETTEFEDISDSEEKILRKNPGSFLKIMMWEKCLLVN